MPELIAVEKIILKCMAPVLPFCGAAFIQRPWRVHRFIQFLSCQVIRSNGVDRRSSGRQMAKVAG